MTRPSERTRPLSYRVARPWGDKHPDLPIAIHRINHGD